MIFSICQKNLVFGYSWSTKKPCSFLLSDVSNCAATFTSLLNLFIYQSRESSLAPACFITAQFHIHIYIHIYIYIHIHIYIHILYLCSYSYIILTVNKANKFFETIFNFQNKTKEDKMLTKVATKKILKKIVAIRYANKKGVSKDIENNEVMRVLVNYIIQTKAVSSFITTISSHDAKLQT